MLTSRRELRLELNITETSPWNLRYPTFFPEPPTSLQTQGEAAWYFYLAEITLRRLKNRVMSSTCASHSAAFSPARVSAVLDFERQAESWSATPPSGYCSQN
jgi:hypothetical protein